MRRSQADEELREVYVRVLSYFGLQADPLVSVRTFHAQFQAVLMEFSRNVELRTMEVAPSELYRSEWGNLAGLLLNEFLRAERGVFASVLMERALDCLDIAVSLAAKDDEHIQVLVAVWRAAENVNRKMFTDQLRSAVLFERELERDEDRGC